MPDARAMPAPCDRCGRNCLPGTADPKARMLRISERRSGYCLDCAVTEWLRITPPICYMLGVHEHAGERMQDEQEYWTRSTQDEERRGPETLLEPHMQQQFGRVMRAAFAQASIDAINWGWIVSNWEIPFPPPAITQERDDDRERGQEWLF